MGRPGVVRAMQAALSEGWARCIYLLMPLPKLKVSMSSSMKRGITATTVVPSDFSNFAGGAETLLSFPRMCRRIGVASGEIYVFEL